MGARSLVFFQVVRHYILRLTVITPCDIIVVSGGAALRPPYSPIFPRGKPVGFG